MESMSIATESSAKRAKMMHVDCKACASKECQKTHFWSKNGFLLLSVIKTSMRYTRMRYIMTHAKNFLFKSFINCNLQMRKIKKIKKFKKGNDREKRYR